MEIRNASRSDVPALEAIWRICFPEDSDAHINWFFSERFSPDRAFVLCEENRIVSCLHIVPYRVKIRGREYAAPFVVGAATLPEVQGRGLMRKLLIAVYEQLHSQGAAVSMLYPFNYGFYRKLGYETVSGQCVYTLTLAEVKKIASSPHALKRREGLTRQALTAETLSAAYDAMMARFDTAMVRTSALCFERADEWMRDSLPSFLCRRDMMTSPEEGRAEGYALFSQHEGHLSVDELVYTDGAALLFLLDCLGATAEKEGNDTIEFPLPAEETIDFLLDDGRDLAKLNPFAMLRILDVERLFEGLPLEPAKSFKLCVKDEQCPWNDAVFEIHPGEHTHITRTGGVAQAQCAITTLAQLATGFLAGSEAIALGLLEGDECVAQAFTRSKNYVFDMY